jgi:hypothetical protein
MTLVCCYRTAPVVIFRGVSNLESRKYNLPPGSTVQITQSGCINEAVFLDGCNIFRNIGLLANAHLYWM